MTKKIQYTDEVKLRLSTYKVDSLGVESLGTFSQREYSHIIPKEISDLNILDSIRHPFLQYEKESGLIRHKGFHHLNSSQALAFNFWFPFCPEGQQLLNWDCSLRLGELLSTDTALVDSAKFEAVVNPDEKTQIDWWCQSASGEQLFCEVKYTETDFGAASTPTTNYEWQFNEIYKPGLAGLVKESAIENLSDFKKHYQIFRNIWHLHLNLGASRNRLVFLLPEKSPTFSKLQHCLDQILEPDSAVRTQITQAPLEQWALKLKASASCLEEARHWRLFINKYCPWAIEASA